MKVVYSVEELRAVGTIGCAFVPTMGALHEGHLSLCRSAKASGRKVVASIFVNPLQFNPTEDLGKYPRTPQQDIARLESVGVDVLFYPTVEEMFPSSAQTRVSLPALSSLYEGEVRPGHFEGVATVVAKLFNITDPELAMFGQKDLQQCAVIRQMVHDLSFPIDIRVCETVRETDGLAMSSRNVYLSLEERSLAPRIYAALVKTKQELEAGSSVDRSLAEGRNTLSSAGLAIDYFDLIDRDSFIRSEVAIPKCAIVTAIRLGTTRLLDNVVLF